MAGQIFREVAAAPLTRIDLFTFRDLRLLAHKLLIYHLNGDLDLVILTSLSRNLSPQHDYKRWAVGDAQ